ncbi:MAG: DUF2938 domain-containing protein [Ectothiorhodospiraceae bacterium]|nr:DUF2938 domain-containing protein [Ectothiorhodospiraceae bacterium]
MNVDFPPVLAVGLLGVGATLIMDAWALLQKKLLGIPSLDYCLVGRWLCHMPGGVFRHHSILSAPPKRRECAVGWTAHYAIGIGLAAGFIGLVSPDWIQRPTLLPALVMGLATVALPFLIMQPLFGLGVAAGRTPRPNQARLRSLVAHATFGFGLYITGIALVPVFGGNS